MSRIATAVIILLLIASAVGIIDAGYLTYESYVANSAVTCPIAENSFLFGIGFDCQTVTTGPYSKVGGVPIALLGLFFYTLVFGIALSLWKQPKNALYLLGLTLVGALVSLWLVYVQVTLIESLCVYCIISAFTSFTLFVLSFFAHKQSTRFSE